jgi:hypothetical protein
MRTKVALVLPLCVGVFAFALFPTTLAAGPPNVKGKITGYEKLVPEVYAEAAKPEARRWTWREPSPSVAGTLRATCASPRRREQTRRSKSFA